MKCINTQQNIMPYINRTLSDAQMFSFLEHIECCEVCRDELETYYMFYMGYNRLETFEEPESYDLKGRLKKELRQMRKYSRTSMVLSTVKNIFSGMAATVCVMLLADYILGKI
ncbi:MAG: hypothetical protein IJM37_03910 [Lachnospiraceae bacterium]|nr:hypothetical protein [Lachnospiraceae bacterium]